MVSYALVMFKMCQILFHLTAFRCHGHWNNNYGSRMDIRESLVTFQKWEAATRHYFLKLTVMEGRRDLYLISCLNHFQAQRWNHISCYPYWWKVVFNLNPVVKLDTARKLMRGCDEVLCNRRLSAPGAQSLQFTYLVSVKEGCSGEPFLRWNAW